MWSITIAIPDGTTKSTNQLQIGYFDMDLRMPAKECYPLKKCGGVR